jgi:CubicO group peptidase (beta-lactamase class C family)
MTTPTSFGYILGQSLTPKWAGKRVDITFPSLVSMLMGFRPLSAKYKARPPFIADSPKFSEFMHTDIGRKGEISSSGAQCNARGLAKLAAIMANKGQPVETQEDNKPLMSEATWEEMHSEPTLAYDGCFPDTRTNFTKGGLNYHVNPENPLQSEAEGLNNNREGFYGWFGFGGSLFQWHPELKIGFAFVPTKLHALEMFNNRASVLQQLVKDCATAKFDK